MSHSFSDAWPNLGVVAADGKLSDHCPIIMKDLIIDFGPRPFRIFDFWMNESDFEEVVKNAWIKTVVSRNPDRVLRDKFKNVKQALKIWSKEKFGTTDIEIEKFKKEALR